MIIQFPIKQEIKLTEEHEKSIEEFAYWYVGMLKDIADDLVTEDTTEQMLGEIFELVLGTLLEKFDEALSEMD